MKLIERTSRTYLWLSIIIFIVFAGILIFVLTVVMNNRLDNQLRYNKEVIAKKIKYEYPLIIFEEPIELNAAEQRKYPNDTVIFKDTLIIRATSYIINFDTESQISIFTAPRLGLSPIIFFLSGVG